MLIIVELRSQKIKQSLGMVKIITRPLADFLINLIYILLMR